MLKKKNRLHFNKDFDYVFKGGQSFYNNSFGIKVVKNNTEETRLGILVSTKISKKAIIRNKIKRRFRNIIKKELIKIKKGKDIVIITLPPIKDKDFLEIKKLIIISLEKLNLYK